MRIFATLCLCSAGAWVAFAQEFEAVSIRPSSSATFDSDSQTSAGALTGSNLTLRSLILDAYRVKDYQVDGPGWLASERFDISAKFGRPLPADREQALEAYASMMRHMLEDRFKLAIHREQRTFTVYGLIAAKGGVKFKQVPDGPGRSDSRNGHYEGVAVTMPRFAEFLSRRSDLPVVDMTGLTKSYTLTLDFFPDPKPGEEAAGPTLREALENQLGLRLEVRKAPIEVIVVDHVERVPTAN